jgi:hypothetical protein
MKNTVCGRCTAAPRILQNLCTILPGMCQWNFQEYPLALVTVTKPNVQWVGSAKQGACCAPVTCDQLEKHLSESKGQSLFISPGRHQMGLLLT